MARISSDQDPGQAREALSRLIDAYNRKDQETLRELYSEEITLWSTLTGRVSGRDQVLAHVRELFTKLPNEHMTADTIVTDGKTLVVELTSSGTDAAGQQYTIRFTEIFELADGLFTAIRTYVDPNDVAEIAH